MAQAVQVFKEAGLLKLRLEEMARGAASVRPKQERAHAMKPSAPRRREQQQFVVDSVAAGLERLSGGDLLFRLTTNFFERV